MFNLIEELEEYISFDENEKISVNKTIDFLTNFINQYNRSNLSGHITAGGLVCDKKGNILLNHHKKSGLWFQFGGHSDGNENSLNVAKREIMEESGITNLQLGKNGIFDVAIMPIPNSEKKQEPEHLHYDINFLFFVEKHDFEISNESIEIRWVSLQEARKLINPNDVGMIRMLNKYEIILNSMKSVNELYNLN